MPLLPLSISACLSQYWWSYIILRKRNIIGYLVELFYAYMSHVVGLQLEKFSINF